MATSEERLQILQASLKENPNDVLTQYMLAMEYKGSNDMQAAIDLLNEIHKINEKYVPAYFLHAQCLEGMESYDAARKMYRLGIEIALKVGDNHAAREMRDALEMLDDEA